MSKRIDGESYEKGRLRGEHDAFSWNRQLIKATMKEWSDEYPGKEKYIFFLKGRSDVIAQIKKCSHIDIEKGQICIPVEAWKYIEEDTFDYMASEILKPKKTIKQEVSEFLDRLDTEREGRQWDSQF